MARKIVANYVCPSNGIVHSVDLTDGETKALPVMVSSVVTDHPALGPDPAWVEVSRLPCEIEIVVTENDDDPEASSTHEDTAHAPEPEREQVPGVDSPKPSPVDDQNPPPAEPNPHASE